MVSAAPSTSRKSGTERTEHCDLPAPFYGRDDMKRRARGFVECVDLRDAHRRYGAAVRTLLFASVSGAK
ncbi:MAG: hypothetical protein ACLS69_01005 [Butyricicoccus sp.]